MGDHRRHGKILIADDVTTMMVGIDDVEDLLVCLPPDLLQPKSGVIWQHRRVDQDHAFAGDDKAYIGPVELGFNKDVRCDFLANDWTSF